ncbi:MAG: sirohydrochlorin chelatase [Pirellulales bacterium]
MENRQISGFLIVGHGTRDPAGQSQFLHIAEQAARRLAPAPVETAFLELAEPSIPAGIAALAARGVHRFVTVPVLLFRAGHADRDIPEAVQAAALEHGMQAVAQSDPLELQEPVLQLSAARFRQALAEHGLEDTPRSRIALAMIARGSSSESAAMKMAEFTCERHRYEPVKWCGIGYVAVRRPNVDDILDQLAAQDADVLVVQPHLLFHGEVWESIRTRMTIRSADDQRPWLITQPLGFQESRGCSTTQTPESEQISLGSVLAELARVKE